MTDHDPVTGQTLRGTQVAQALPDWMSPQQETLVAPAAVSPVPPVDPGDADLFEDGWNAPRRTSRFTALLVAGLVAAAGFAGGAYLQRSHDQALIPTASAAGAGARAFGAGGFGGGGFGGGTGGAGGAGTGTTGGAGAGGAATTGTPVAVGTVSAIEGGTLTVKNFAGTAIVVHVGATTTVTSVGLGGLKPGATVAVFGTKAADGSVTATSVVSRRAG